MDFVTNSDHDRRVMLEALGLDEIEELFREVPPGVRLNTSLNIPPALAEGEVLKEMRRLASGNRQLDDIINFLGAGAYEHFIPSVVGHLASLPQFVTAYTPYQPEASQGILQAFFEFQTLVCQLTAMEVANASLYDGATAAVEAIRLACGQTKKKVALVSRGLHPEYRQVINTYAATGAFEVAEIGLTGGVTVADPAAFPLLKHAACLVLQNPNFLGVLEDGATLTRLAHEAGALSIIGVDPISLGVLEPPGAYEADLVFAEGQGLGLPLSWGGPYLGILAARRAFLRSLPGRVVGQTVDRQGERGFVLTLQTREQHIRRERATSNICSNEALAALRAAVYMSVMGPEGIREVAEQCLAKAHFVFDSLKQVPFLHPILEAPFYQEFVLGCDKDPVEVLWRLGCKGILGGFNLTPYYPEMGSSILFCCTEVRTREEIESLAAALEEMA